MQHFIVPCEFGSRKAPFPLYVGEPADDAEHPLEQQARWLRRERGGTMTREVLDSFAKLHAIALENNVSYEELCVYAMKEALGQQDAAHNDRPGGEER